MSHEDEIPLQSTLEDEVYVRGGRQSYKSNSKCLRIVLGLLVFVVGSGVGLTLAVIRKGINMPTSTSFSAYTPTSTPFSAGTPTSTPLPAGRPTFTPLPAGRPTFTPLPGGGCEDDNTVCPSPRDGRIYKFVNLESNGLRVVLISDPNTDLSGASMSVAAGSFEDPADYEGLAHFCEHMLFLGTKKYPDNSEYSNYLSTHGGLFNAYTSNQETNYFFQIQDGFLEQALDLFAHFFIDPLFNPIYTNKELNAVNQEHEKNLVVDEWKLLQLLKQVSNPNHPFSQFATGNFETLNKTNTRKQLLKYYKDFYSASTMNLVVYGRKNVSVLYDMVKRSFSAISNTGLSPKTYSTVAFPEPYLGRIIVYRPQAKDDVLTLYWQTVGLDIYHRNTVFGFIAYYLRHEGEGSLLSFLQTYALANALQAGVEVNADSFYLFKIQIGMTDAGMANVRDVIRVVFQFTQLLDKMTEAEFEIKWADYLSVNGFLFDYAEKSSPSDYASGITTVMRVVQHPADFLPNPRRYISNYSLVHSIIHSFTPANSEIFIGTQNINSSPMQGVQVNRNKVPIPAFNSVEPIYSTPYTVYKIPQQLMLYWNSFEDNPELKIADPNMFVPDRTHLVPAPMSNLTAPQPLSGTTAEAWVFPDTKSFYEPKVNLMCELKTANAEKSANWEALSRMYVEVVSTKLRPILYSASMIGYTASVTSTPRGIQLSLEGLSDEDIILRLINTLMRTLVNENDILRDDITFRLAMNGIFSELFGFNYTVQPYLYTFSYIQSLLLDRPYWTNDNILLNVYNRPLKTVLNFGSSSLLRNMAVVCLVHGSTSTAIADSYIKLITDILNGRIDTNSQVDEGFLRTRVILPAGIDYGLSLLAFNPADANSAVNVLFQARSVCMVENGACSHESLLTGLHLSLLDHIISDACFTQLRTQEGLGYIVFCFSKVNEGIGSFQAIVQSEEFTPAHVLQSINAFMDDFYNTMVMSDEFADNFDKTIEVLRKSLSENDLILSDKTSRVWLEIMSHRHQFNLQYQQLDTLTSLTVQTFREFYRNLILESTMRRKLSIVVYGQGKEITVDELDVDCVVDQLEQTKTTLQATCT